LKAVLALSVFPDTEITGATIHWVVGGVSRVDSY